MRKTSTIAIGRAERRYQAVFLFYKEDYKFIISSHLLTLNFNKEIGIKKIFF